MRTPLLRWILKRGALSGSLSYLAPLEPYDGHESTEDGNAERDPNSKTDFGSCAEAR